MNQICSQKYRKALPIVVVVVHVLTILCLNTIRLSAQTETDNPIDVLITKKIKANKDTLIIDQNTILPGTIKFKCLDENEPIYSLENNVLKISGPHECTSLKYKTLDFNLFESGSLLDSSQINKDERILLLKPDNNNKYNSRRLIESSELNYRGNFTRGISFGNTQDVVLNSNLNLQLSGDLGKELYITAAISDENIPLQPEGNTQILQEFNKVFIQIEKNNTKVIAGDYELGRPRSYFMNYFKKLKGLSVLTSHTVNDWTINNKASFAVSRGKFRRHILNTQEGNQGPYRLEGEDGEVFLQVLSGTEKIYADGRLLQRGENNDYIIDYNRAEVRFTPRCVITANLRIIVEFEYAVQSYLRSLYATETQFENKKWKFVINTYSEQDSKSSSGSVQLDSSDIRILRESGDGDSFRSGIYSIDSELDNIIRYRLDNGILIHEPQKLDNTVGANFSNFGSNMGSYSIDNEAGANGRVYRYVGSNNGSYEPLIRLVAPEQKQLFTAAIHHQLSDSTDISIETSLSHLDINRFSQLDNEDNSGMAISVSAKDTRQIQLFKNKGKDILHTSFLYEFANENFEALNPYRAVEFIRDWNLTQIQNKNDQNFLNSFFSIGNEQRKINYRIQYFADKNQFTGLRHIPEFKLNSRAWKLWLKGDWLNSQFNENENVFFRPRAELSKSILQDRLEIGSYFEKEKNTSNISQDSLINGGFNYDLIRNYIRFKNQEVLMLQLGYSTRIDDRVSNGALEKITQSHNWELTGFWNHTTHSKLQWQFTFRDFEVEENYIETEQAKRSFIGNIDHNLSLFNNGLSLSSYYESNTGQEPKIEFEFIKVQTGEGSYIWNDYNQDSIQQINEFEIAPFSDLASYEKISIFNNEFLATCKQVLNQSLKLDPKRILKNKNGFVSRIYLFSRYRIDQKNTSEENKFFNFIDFNHNSNNLVSYNSSSDHSLFLNRGQVKWDFQFSLRSINNKTLQISGFEQRRNKEYFTKIRFNLIRQLDLINNLSIGQTNRSSENFVNQNYLIDFWKNEIQLNYRPNSKFRIITSLKLENKENKDGLENEASDIVDLGLELSWRQASNSNLEFNFHYISINFKGDSNKPVAFEMLQGLNDGSNILLGINYTRRVSESIDMILNYNARKPADVDLINTASLQMRAVF